MGKYFDIEDECFEKIKAHETTSLILLNEERAQRIMVGDSLKLYHNSDPEEALRVLVKKVEEDEREIRVEFELSEWMFRMETELDDWIREEKAMLSELGLFGSDGEF